MENSLKLKIQNHSDEDLLKIYQLKNEYSSEAIQYVKEELDQRGISYQSSTVEKVEVTDVTVEQEEDGLLKENWTIIFVLILLPFGILLVGDTEFAQNAGRKIVPAIICLVVYALFMRFMLKFPSEKRFTHYSIIYFIIWLILVITSS